MSRRGRSNAAPPRQCAVCGCTDLSPCVGPDGKACHWVDPDICSGCVEAGPALADELRQGGYAELAGRLDKAYERTRPLVELATMGELNMTPATRPAWQPERDPRFAELDSAIATLPPEERKYRRRKKRVWTEQRDRELIERLLRSFCPPGVEPGLKYEPRGEE